MSVTVRELSEKDVRIASEIEKNCLSTFWSENQIASLPENAVYLVAESENVICGIGSMYCVFDDCEIMNIAVSEDQRKKGVATAILASLIETASKKGCGAITLEVASDNEKAISLYRKFGFVPVGTRKGFYNGSDATVMQKTILEK